MELAMASSRALPSTPLGALTLHALSVALSNSAVTVKRRLGGFLDVVAIVQQYHVGRVVARFGGIELAVGDDDDLVVLLHQARGGAVDADNLGPARGLDG